MSLNLISRIGLGAAAPHGPLKTRGSRGFTLIEILIVVVILGILAAVVLPQFSNASHLTRENTLKDDLRYLRMQVTVFKAQHRDAPPGYPGGSTSAAPTETDLLAQMSGYTDDHCDISTTASSSYPLGPYLEKIPANPINGKSSVNVIANGQAMPAATGNYGWIYKPETLEVMPDLTGNGSDGKPYAQY